MQKPDYITTLSELNGRTIVLAHESEYDDGFFLKLDDGRLAYFDGCGLETPDVLYTADAVVLGFKSKEEAESERLASEKASREHEEQRARQQYEELKKRFEGDGAVT